MCYHHFSSIHSVAWLLVRNANIGLCVEMPFWNFNEFLSHKEKVCSSSSNRKLVFRFSVFFCFLFSFFTSFFLVPFKMYSINFTKQITLSAHFYFIINFTFKYSSTYNLTIIIPNSHFVLEHYKLRFSIFFLSSLILFIFRYVYELHYVLYVQTM